MATLTFDEAAHLLRRAGFGGNADEIDDLATRGREGAVDTLINHQQIDNRQMDDLLKASFNFSNPADFAPFNRSAMLRLWCTRMVCTRRPVEEKITLFWHNHFATATSKVEDIWMYIQNLML